MAVCNPPVPEKMILESEKKLFCYRCYLYLPFESFTKSQLQRLPRFNDYIPKNAQKVHYPTCSKCTITSVEELTCEICNLKKSIDDYAKSQRRNKGRHRCKQCIEIYQNDDPEYAVDEVFEYDPYAETEDDKNYDDFIYG